MLKKTLVIGDVHCTPQEINDCIGLGNLIIKTVKDHKPERVLFLGDLYNTHDVLNTRCIDFYKDLFDSIFRAIGKYPHIIVGNHDQYTPSIRHPHALLAHLFEGGPTIIDRPVVLDDGICAVPYFYDPKEFVQAVKELKEQNPQSEVLFCHQTFDGADLGEGFYAKDAVNPEDVPFRSVISGHIHSPMKLGKVVYIGAPRWRTLTDAKISERNLWLLGGGSPILIPTSKSCRRIYKFVDHWKTPAEININDDELALADIRVDIYGDPEYIKNRIQELRAKYNIRYRTFPLYEKRLGVSEAMGVKKALEAFLNTYKAPLGTPTELLKEKIEDRFNGK